MKEMIIELTLSGNTQKQIANKLNISLDKVRYWQKKLNVSANVERTVKCNGCNQTFKTSNKLSKYCSEKCRIKFHSKRYVAEGKKKKIVCKECKEEFEIPFKSTAKEYGHCCYDCKLKRQKRMRKKKPQSFVGKSSKVFFHRCECCGVSFTTGRAGKRRYCIDCKGGRVKVEDIQKKCKECGKHFTTTRNSKTFCSTVCNRKYHHRIKETTRRERIKLNGKVDHSISIERLIKRDGKMCYLCNEKVKLLTDTNHPEYPSIEHVIPIAKGGTHTWDNVKLAHRKCNCEKGINIIT